MPRTLSVRTPAGHRCAFLLRRLPFELPVMPNFVASWTSSQRAARNGASISSFVPAGPVAPSRGSP
jgi:hypothetical protein